MPIELKLLLDKKELGYTAKVTWVESKGTVHSSIDIGQESMEKAVMSAISPISVIAPNMAQEEIDKHHEHYL